VDEIDLRDATVVVVEATGTLVVLGIGYDPKAAHGAVATTVTSHTWSVTRLN
jgi:hypothetical protein